MSGPVCRLALYRGEANGRTQCPRTYARAKRALYCPAQLLLLFLSAAAAAASFLRPPTGKTPTFLPSLQSAPATTISRPRPAGSFLHGYGRSRSQCARVRAGPLS
jgi:hypothetical protein